jgi:UDP-2-acetamido-3-amino-2,3-dideoxy-glucuronate N-acetyltransferase
MSESPHVAVVGCGVWGKNLVRNFASLGALAGVCDADAERAAKAADAHGVPRLGWREVLGRDDIRGVVLATPAERHFEMAQAALHAGKDVFVEKPLALRAREGEALRTLAESGGRVLMVGHLLLHHPAIETALGFVARGELGKIHYIYSTRTNLGTVRREENILWSFAPHDLSVIVRLLGELPTEVTATGGNYLHPTIADVTVTTLAFPSGVRAHVFVSWLHPYKEQRLSIIGEKAMIVFDDVATEHKLVLYPHTVDWVDRKPVAKKGAPAPIPFEPTEPLRRECQHFLDCIRDRRRPTTDAQNGTDVLRVLEACQRSLEARGRPERVLPTTTPYFAHETAVVDEPSEIGERTKIWHFTHVQSHARIGRDCVFGQNVLVGPHVTVGDRVHVQNNVSVYAGVTLEDGVFVGPSAVFTNIRTPRSEFPRKDALVATRVRHGASIGANATIVCGVTIGRYALIGAGAVVTHDVPDHALVVGNPARIVGWACACGLRLEAVPQRTAAGAIDDDGDNGDRGLEGAATQATVAELLCPGCGRAYTRGAIGLVDLQNAEAR